MKPKGISDPWRKVAALHPAAKAPVQRGARIDIDDIDYDADLAIPLRHVIRLSDVSFDILSTQMTSSASALDVLAECVLECWKVPTLAQAFLDANIAVRCPNGTRNAPSDESHASALRGENATLWFVGVPLDLGARMLVKILRKPEAAHIIKQWGVTPMSTG